VKGTGWKDRRVLVTGHSGFMGGWLVERLLGLGAHVTGFALPAPTEPNLFACLDLDGRMESVAGDLRDVDALTQTFGRCRPEIVFHLAAQPLVRRAHRDPIETFSTNIMGTINVLEAIRQTPSVAAAIVVTTDKVYENREWNWGYRETDALGGHEPYGVSKACAELAVDAYVRAYYGTKGPAVATVRAGNIIGGGDWAADRLVPDAVRAFAAGEILRIRHPDAVRPWQHVLEPVEGMLKLAVGLEQNRDETAGAWNFGPAEEDARTVAWVADRLVRAWGDNAAWAAVPDVGPHEAKLLTLSSSKAHAALGWACRWNAETAISETAKWYRAFYRGEDTSALTRKQINDYVKGDDRGESEREAPEERNRAVA
jgi:CDP-glucose 4,6-dehydratase